ncbi:platelet-derived growth factor receptor alpha-like isoform X2 [Paramacrobiotus metropolitanus]|uniref:platelet-derived growth factor receptor alpha-like isoform X2 n=1 Tax=Paramacrobiotus metropolitanus TaxID=2943436 RepID=UPI002445C6B4|nr:platelet-derived growth factor receptor alpha-like isoform X2 [Paramacrobiotus metropolitanus]
MSDLSRDYHTLRLVWLNWNSISWLLNDDLIMHLELPNFKGFPALRIYLTLAPNPLAYPEDDMMASYHRDIQAEPKDEWSFDYIAVCNSTCKPRAPRLLMSVDEMNGVGEHALWIALGVVIPISAVALIVCGIVKNRKRLLRRDKMKPSVNRFHGSFCLTGNLGGIQTGSFCLDYPVELEKYVNLLEVPLAHVHITNEILGQGKTGVVCKGLARDLHGKFATMEVAVKTIRNAHDPRQIRQLTQEIEVMAHAGRHLNIINLLGIVVKGKLLLLMEYAQFGSLLMFLKSYRHLDEEIHLGDARTLGVPFETHQSANEEQHGNGQHLSSGVQLNFAYQISRGMEYLSKRSIVHRDLAARNVLICEGLITKVSDFGMAKKGAPLSHFDPEEELPLRWMPPEAMINRMFSEKSDVWSFGVVVWEIFSLGAVPYGGTVTARNISDFPSFLNGGLRLEKPEACPPVIYDLACRCWSLTSGERPTFAQLSESLRHISSVRSEEDYLPLDDPYTLFNEEYHVLLRESTDICEPAIKTDGSA